MPYVSFAEFKRVNESRTVVNNAMVALLAGSRLASHTLTLTSGSPQLLPQIFPQVANIDRFNLVPDRAKSLLDEADQHVAAVSVPYALSVHEDFTMGIIEMVRSRGTRVVAPGGRGMGPVSMHEALFAATNHALPADALEIFHILREMRNSQIHEGGRANSRLVAQVSLVSTAAEKTWLSIVGVPPASAVDNGRVRFTLGHMFIAFAVVKLLAREINIALQTHWTSPQWADILVRDYSAATTNIRNSSSWRRSVLGRARLDFAPIGLTDAEIETAARGAGQWTATRWQ